MHCETNRIAALSDPPAGVVGLSRVSHVVRNFSFACGLMFYPGSQAVGTAPKASEITLAIFFFIDFFFHQSISPHKFLFVFFPVYSFGFYLCTKSHLGFFPSVPGQIFLIFWDDSEAIAHPHF